ncbi:MAG: class I mannose-6-phosphate isomerase [Lacrimispora sp.]
MGYEPVKVKGERVWRTYIGGGMIGCLHGKGMTEDGHFPEEWMYSVTRAINAGREELTEGLCRIDDDSGITLIQLIEKEPEAMLGKNHVEKWGVTPGVLIKIIDSLERLTVQVHPDKQMAEKLFHSRFGKTECWHILGTRKGLKDTPCIYLGFKEGITRQDWISCFESQDYDRMLSLLNRIEVKKGETYLVRGGVPHAIGPGCMMIEIQEPTDFTIRVEKVTPSGFEIDDRMCHQGLGFQKMFDCFTYAGKNEEQIRKESCIRAEELSWSGGKRYRLVGYENTPCFQMEKLEIHSPCELEGEGVFCCLYVLSGKGTLRTDAGNYRIGEGDQFFVPADSGKYRIGTEGFEPVILLKLYGPE